MAQQIPILKKPLHIVHHEKGTRIPKCLGEIKIHQLEKETNQFLKISMEYYTAVKTNESYLQMNEMNFRNIKLS